MDGSAQTSGAWLAILCGVVLACGRPPGADVPDTLKDEPQAQPKATTSAPPPSEQLKPMKVGGEVSAPKPTTRLNIRWPGDPTQCYQLGFAVFEYVIDSTGMVRDVKLIKGVDNEYTKAARAAIEHQKFEPAIYRGKPVDVTSHVSVNHVPVKKVKGPC
jgi:hypothetical protein